MYKFILNNGGYVSRSMLMPIERRISKIRKDRRSASIEQPKIVKDNHYFWLFSIIGRVVSRVVSEISFWITFGVESRVVSSIFGYLRQSSQENDVSCSMFCVLQSILCYIYGWRSGNVFPIGSDGQSSKSGCSKKCFIIHSNGS